MFEPEKSMPWRPDDELQLVVVYVWGAGSQDSTVAFQWLEGCAGLFREDFPLRTCDFDDPSYRELLDQWHVLLVPTLILVENGQSVEQLVGLGNRAFLEEMLLYWRREYAD